MASTIAERFRSELKVLGEALHAVSPEIADKPWREGGWTRKQTVGHLLDSAANNRQRFVRASIEGVYTGPKYAQDGWVTAHGYVKQSWETLLAWWDVEHAILASVVEQIPEERMQALCKVGDDEPVTLQFLIEDYIEHQKWHLRQITAV